MEDFIKRLLEEKEQLNEKIEKLDTFLKSAKVIEEDVQIALLNCQLQAMLSYSTCLNERLSRLEY